MKQIFESENIRFVAVSERLVQDYLIMVNDFEHVQKYLGGQHEPYTEEQEIRWVKTNYEMSRQKMRIGWILKNDTPNLSVQ